MSIEWLKGRTAVVTGAGRGIGRSVAIELAAAGADVVLASRTQGELEEAVQTAGNNARYVVCDVGTADGVRKLFDEAGDVTVLVCAAAVLHKALVGDTTDEVWTSTLDINLTGTFRCCRSAFESMRKNGGGRIVTFSSLSGVYATEKFPGLAAYNVSKFGVIGLTEALAVEGREYGIQSVCISPGAVDTQMLREAAAGLKAGLTPDDVGRFVRVLLDEDFGIASGANIPLFSNL